LVGITAFFLDEGQNLNFALPAEWVQAMLEVRGARGRGSQKDPGVLFQATAFMHNAIEFEGGGLLPDVVSSARSSAMWAIADAVMICLLQQTQTNPFLEQIQRNPDCSHNWPLWKEASLQMLELRGEIQGLESAADDQDRAPRTDKYQSPQFTRSIATAGRSVWSDLWEVYCQDRPGGIYTDLHNKIRACPGKH
jgi:hypothetical protein